MSKRADVIVKSEETEIQKRIMLLVSNMNSGTEKYAFVETYGCAQNVNDSGHLLGMLESMGYKKTEDKQKADVIIYNTCAVREGAELKVFGNIGALKALKREKPNLIIGVCGCMMQQEHIVEQIKKRYKHVDIVFGTHSLHRFPEILYNALTKGERVIEYKNCDGFIAEDIPMYRDSGSPLAGVSVMYGCNNFCTYCIVPYVRGRERSRRKEDILKEVADLAACGVKEVMLLGQNVNSYGKDIEGYIDFPDLLNEVSKIDGIERIRFMTSHPKDFSDKLIDTIANNKKVCKQLHLPVQCGSNKILKAMNRKYTREEYLEKLNKIKALVPEITLTTDIIVGFPGEDNNDFEQTLEILKEARYDSVFSFIYSKRHGTPAEKMPDVLTKEEKKKNFDKMLELQNVISAEKNAEYHGKKVEILVEGESKTNRDFLTGRTDGGKIVNFKGSKSLIGTLVKVKITEAHTWSLTGELI